MHIVKSRKREWYDLHNGAYLAILRSFMVEGVLKLGASMVDGRYISSMGWEGDRFVVSAEYR